MVTAGGGILVLLCLLLWELYALIETTTGI
jgi:hypothetical protein